MTRLARPYCSEHDRAQPIVEIMERAGHEISLADAYWAWEQYSENMSAGWLMTCYEQEVIAAVLFRMEVLP